MVECTSYPGYFELPTLLQTTGLQSNRNTTCHVCDASTLAYGCRGYLRMVGGGGQIHCVFIRGLARLCPKIPITVPRLELVAAVAAAELARAIVLELEYNIGEVFFYTDSTTVLHFINNRAQRFKTFVANRVNFIHLLSKPFQWGHVLSTENPADIASRGLFPEDISKAKLWFEGPSFLKGANRPPLSLPLLENRAALEAELK